MKGKETTRSPRCTSYHVASFWTGNVWRLALVGPPGRRLTPVIVNDGTLRMLKVSTAGLQEKPVAGVTPGRLARSFYHRAKLFNASDAARKELRGIIAATKRRRSKASEGKHHES